jgi:hypothetical protein
LPQNDPGFLPVGGAAWISPRQPLNSRKRHGSKNDCGAEAFSAFSSVLQTAVKSGVSSTIDTLQNLFCSKPRDS